MYNPYSNISPDSSTHRPQQQRANIAQQQQQQQQQQQFVNPIPQPQAQYAATSPHPPQQQQTLDQNFSNFFNQTNANLGFQFTHGAFNYAQQNVSNYIPKEDIKKYFQINNSYVFKKLMLLLFPFRNKQWARLPMTTSENKQVYSSPIEDINAPDLYIPLMGFITFILIRSIVIGVEGEFDPQILSLLFSKDIAIYILDVVILWFGFFVFNVQDYKYFDILSYTGYKFVPISVLVLIKEILGGRFIFYLSFIYLLISYGFFLIRSMRSIVFNTSAGIGIKNRSKEIFMFGYCFIAQLLIFFIL